MQTFLSQTLDDDISSSHLEVWVLVQLVSLVEGWGEGAVGPVTYTVLLNEIHLAVETWICRNSRCENIFAIMILLK